MRRRLLNVGGADKSIAIPAHYTGWEHVLLDIDPGRGVDLVCDARRLAELPPAQFDAVYCSHNLEHYHLHEVPLVLAGFQHVLTPEGFAEIRVPDIGAVMRHAVAHGMDLGDILYESPGGPITVHDVLYGYGIELERTGNDYYAHKCGFTRKSLMAVLLHAGFTSIWVADNGFEAGALAFKAEPTAEQKTLLQL
jgi:hypothetical protein